MNNMRGSSALSVSAGPGAFERTLGGDDQTSISLSTAALSANAGGSEGDMGVQGMDHRAPGKASTAQKSFWQAITMGCFETVKVLLEHREININQYDVDGEQRQGGTALHLAILEMPTWKGSEGRNGIQTAEFVRKFIRTLLDYGADTEMVCRYKGEWYLQTAAGKTKSFFPEGYDGLGLVLQFIEITRGADVIANDVTKRLELIRDILLEHIHQQDLKSKQCNPVIYKPRFSESMLQMYKEGRFTDIDIRCEGRVFKVHRVVLAARSHVFDTMFSSNLLESVQNIVEVKEVDPNALEAFLYFMYTDKIEENHLQHASDLLVLANRYDVPDLKDMCTQTLAHNLTVQNAAGILSIADTTHTPILKRCALQFISENIRLIHDQSEDYANLGANLVRDILESMMEKHPRKRAKLGNRVHFFRMPASTPTPQSLASPGPENVGMALDTVSSVAQQSGLRLQRTSRRENNTADGTRSAQNEQSSSSATPADSFSQTSNGLSSQQRLRLQASSGARGNTRSPSTISTSALIIRPSSTNEERASPMHFNEVSDSETTEPSQHSVTSTAQASTSTRDASPMTETSAASSNSTSALESPVTRSPLSKESSQRQMNRLGEQVQFAQPSSSSSSSGQTRSQISSASKGTSSSSTASKRTADVSASTD